MATAFTPPEGFEPPEITLDNMRDGSYEREEAAFLERLADRAKMNGTSPLLGEVVRWQRADGYAQYMVWQTKPLQLDRARADPGTPGRRHPRHGAAGRAHA